MLAHERTLFVWFAPIRPHLVPVSGPFHECECVRRSNKINNNKSANWMRSNKMHTHKRAKETEHFNCECEFMNWDIFSMHRCCATISPTVANAQNDRKVEKRKDQHNEWNVEKCSSAFAATNSIYIVVFQIAFDTSRNDHWTHSHDILRSFPFRWALNS